MREIKFRGKTFGNEWVHGNLIRQIKDDGVESCYIRPIKIDSKPVSIAHIKKGTLSQFTGLTDKNGKEIYEGDIVEVLLSDKHAFGVVEYGKTGICAYVAMSYSVYSNYVLDKSENFNVIGNIYDNPELIKE